MMATEKRLIDANALQFEPDENCIANGVLIWGGRNGGKTMTTVLSALKVMIDNAPTVDAVEVVHGQWEFSHTTTVEKFNVVKCSNCGHEAFAIAIYVKQGRYCPNCGAKMDDERRGE